MGERGPAAKPQALKKMQGTYRPDRDGGADDALDDRKPYCPGWLDEDARKEWRRIAGPLHEAGLLKWVDQAALAGYCQAYARWKAAEETVAKSGLLIKTTKGNVIQNPAVGIANTALRDMLRIAKEFGMTPSARARIVVGDGGEAKEMTLADALFQMVANE